MTTRLPLEIIQRLADHLDTCDALKLSTCHSTLYGSLKVPKLCLDLVDESTVRSACMWLKKNPNIATESLFLRDAHGVTDGTDFFQHVVRAYGTSSIDLQVECMHQPEALLTHMPFVNSLVCTLGGYDSYPSLQYNVNLERLILLGGLETDIDDECIGLLGITEAPHLQHLTIINQDTPLCLCELPNLKQLTHLELIGTEYTPGIVKSIRNVRFLHELKYLTVDSYSELLEDPEVLRDLKHVEVLDLSRRHRNYTDPYTEDEIHDPTPDFVQGIRSMPYLKTFGARDLILDSTFGSSSIETLIMSLDSLLESLNLEESMTLANFPKLTNLEIVGGMQQTLMEDELEWIQDLFRGSSVTLTLRRAGVAIDMCLENEILTTWFGIAHECPGMRIVVQ